MLGREKGQGLSPCSGGANVSAALELGREQDQGQGQGQGQRQGQGHSGHPLWREVVVPPLQGGEGTGAGGASGTGSRTTFYINPFTGLIRRTVSKLGACQVRASDKVNVCSSEYLVSC
jgi:hypothetical protein